MGFKNTVIVNQGGGNVPAGAAVLTDSFNLLEVVAPDTNAAQTDVATFALEANYSETTPAPTEAVNVGISGYQESNPAPAEMRESVVDRFATASSGGTNPANAQGSPNGTLATVKAGGVANGSTTMTVDIVQPLTGAGSTPTFRGVYRNTGGLLDSFVQTLQYTQAAVGTTSVTPTIAGTSQANYQTGASGNTITLPADINDGDFGIISVFYVTNGTGDTGVVPSGWQSAGATNTHPDSEMFVVYKTMSVSDRNTTVQVIDTTNPGAAIFFISLRTHGGLKSIGNAQAVSEQQNISSAPVASSPLGIALHFVGMGIETAVNAAPNIASNDGLTETYESPDNNNSGVSFYVQACYTETTGSSVPTRSFSVLNAQNAKTNFRSADVCTIVLEPGTVAAGGTQTINLPIGNFLTTPIEIPLTAVNNGANIRATFTHNAVVPLLGGQTDVDAISIRSTGVL